MRGRGLLIAAAVIHLLGAGLVLTGAIRSVAMREGDGALLAGTIGFLFGVIALGVFKRSLLAWCMSLFVSAVILLGILAVASPLARQGSSLVGLAIVAAVVANVVLLVFGRRAVLAQ